MSYMDLYAEHMNACVENDPHIAVGGLWEEIGKLQFDFLIDKGLNPKHKMLDIGCGTLRGGRHFIRYLDVGNYYGIDVSSEVIQYGVKLLVDEGLIDKGPTLIINGRKDLKFKVFNGDKFDYILAQSVFTHLKPEHIEECFQCIGGVMGNGSLFYFTFFYADVYRQVGDFKFRYPFSFFESLAQENGFRVYDCSLEYNHPRNQWMVELVKDR